MKTPKQLQSMSEKAGKWFLRASMAHIERNMTDKNTIVVEIKNTIVIPVNEENLFHDDLYSPHLMHLAKREMEKRGFDIHHEVPDKNYYKWYFSKVPWPCGGSHEWSWDANDFIAFWDALLEAIK